MNNDGKLIGLAGMVGIFSAGWPVVNQLMIKKWNLRW